MRKRRNWAVVAAVLLAAAVAGTVVGDVLGKSLPWVGQAVAVGLNPPVRLDLNVIDLTFGLGLRMNLVGAAALLLSLLVVRRL
ncbi:MAG: DUF4321 domain-containing protein [Acetobacteraceae bacterium]|nr:DUF4321 domain-containing protein [Acetobacteraceae bacterium]